MNNNDIQILDKQTIESMIYTIRGQKVMLDFELAKIYGYSTKRFNEQVKNNIEKFPERYRFKLLKEELNICSRPKKSTLNNNDNLRGLNVKYLPYAFTEQGIYVLITILEGKKYEQQ